MISYAEMKDSVLGALQREGGELSLAELSELTHLPSEALDLVRRDLAGNDVVKTREEPQSRLKMVLLTRRGSLLQSIMKPLRSAFGSNR